MQLLQAAGSATGTSQNQDSTHYSTTSLGERFAATQKAHQNAYSSDGLAAAITHMFSNQL